MAMLALTSTVSGQAATLDEYKTAQEALPADLRECSAEDVDATLAATATITNKQDAEGADEAAYTRFRMRVPQSGWALKRFPGVKEWVNRVYTDTAVIDQSYLVIERTEPIPEVLVYDVQN